MERSVIYIPDIVIAIYTSDDLKTEGMESRISVKFLKKIPGKKRVTDEKQFSRKNALLEIIYKFSAKVAETERENVRQVVPKKKEKERERRRKK